MDHIHNKFLNNAHRNVCIETYGAGGPSKKSATKRKMQNVLLQCEELHQNKISLSVSSSYFAV